MSNQNRLLVSRLYSAFNSKELDVLDEFVVADFVDHHPGPGQPDGLAGLKKSFCDFFAAFPDVTVENQAIVCEGDLVMVRSRCRGTHTGALLSIPATGKAVDFDSIDNWRIENGRLVEVWHVEDIAKMLLQIGALSLP